MKTIQVDEGTWEALKRMALVGREPLSAVVRRLAGVEAPAAPPESAATAQPEREMESKCRKCQVPWRLHQSGSRKNRAELSGCSTFTD